jgi:membrane protein implicated in regulation of membrane protease activity
LTNEQLRGDGVTTGAGGALVGTIAAGVATVGALVAVVASIMWVRAGRRVKQNGASDEVVALETVGRVGRIVEPVDALSRLVGPYRVRIALQNGMVELVARADVPLAIGDAVLVEAVRGHIASVSRAPRELISDPPPSAAGRDPRV